MSWEDFGTNGTSDVVARVNLGVHPLAFPTGKRFVAIAAGIRLLTSVSPKMEFILSLFKTIKIKIQIIKVIILKIMVYLNSKIFWTVRTAVGTFTSMNSIVLDQKFFYFEIFRTESTFKRAVSRVHIVHVHAQ